MSLRSRGGFLPQQGSHELTAAPALPLAVRSAIVWSLTDEGFPRDQADAWADGWVRSPDVAIVVHQAIAFDDHGVPIAEAIAWHQHGFFAYEACPLYDARWKPHQAAVARDLSDGTGTELDDWAALDLRPARVIEYLRARVDVSEVSAFESIADGPSDALALLAAFF